MPSVSGNVGAVGPLAGTYLPVADLNPGLLATVDSTTYNDPINAGAKLRTLVFPDAGEFVFAVAVLGDAFPRWLLVADATNGLYMGDGTFDPYSTNKSSVSGNDGVEPSPATGALGTPRLNQVSPRFTITSGALPTVQLVSGAGAQVSTARDTETYTPLTLTTAGGTVVVALSPDNTTYSTVMTVTPAVNASVTDVTVRVPAGWYLKMTATNATLGLTTYA